VEQIGVRDLKAKLSAVLRSVERGDTVRVTSRGRPIADIVPAGSTGSVEDRLDALEAAGILTRATKPLPKQLSPPEEQTQRPLASEWIIAERDRYR
jgi:prevent-host-death family protein